MIACMESPTDSSPSADQVTCRICGGVFAKADCDAYTFSADETTVWCPTCKAEKRRGYARKQYVKRVAEAEARGGPHKRYPPRDPERERELHRRRALAYARRNTVAARHRHIRDKYRLTVDEFNAMLEAQDHRCALCRSVLAPENSKRFVDHDHACCPSARTCGKCIRGILCRRCNQGLGLFRDDPDQLRAAIEYVVDFRKTLNLPDVIVDEA